MPFDEAEELRIQAIEKVLNRIQTAINGLAAKETLTQLSLLRQSEIDTMKTQIINLETAVQLLQQD
jgi:hypothetical protein